MAKCKVFSAEEIVIWRKAGAILAECLQYTKQYAKEGTTTLELDTLAEEFILERGGKPAFKGYQGYPNTLCTSVNDQCVHTIPNETVLKNGDIISIDCGVAVDGLCTDACITVPVGDVSTDATNIMRATEDALAQAVMIMKGGVMTGDIGYVVEECAKEYGVSVVRELTGHGLGTSLHEYPNILNYGKPGSGVALPAGTVVAVEPIFSTGSGNIKEGNWTISSSDGGLCSHHEHTILVTDSGCEILA